MLDIDLVVLNLNNHRNALHGKNSLPANGHIPSSPGLNVFFGFLDFSVLTRVIFESRPKAPHDRHNQQTRVPRFMSKSGQCNIKHDAKEKTKRFLQDFFTTMVDMEWHYSNWEITFGD